MEQSAPQLEALLHRLAECPAEFLDDGVHVVAIVCDTLRPITAPHPPELQREAIAEIQRRAAPELKLISVVCWLLADDWFRGQQQLAPAMWKLLTSDRWARLTKLVRPEKFVSDADRREELVRTCLAELGLRPQGETPAQAADRLTTLDSAERDRVLRATAAAERRAREVREAMARKQAQESASRYGE